jgi:hypothetical protein
MSIRTCNRCRSSGVSMCLLTGLNVSSSSSLDPGVPDAGRYEGPEVDITGIVQIYALWD